MTKVCPNPHCEAVFHNCQVKDTRCLDCNGWIMLVNEETFFKKFSDNWFQYDYQTGEYLRKQKPLPSVIQLSLF